MTPEDARGRTCVHNLNHECIATACMAWRWNRANETKEYLSEVQAEMKKYSGKGKGSFMKASATVFKNWRLFHETEGYCGLAGKPEIGRAKDMVDE